jgi:protein O-mannosyl-transferase
VGLTLFALTLVALIYWQGVYGLFMLDDVANIELLVNQIRDEGFWAGVFGGNSGPTGRPLSVLTLALQLSSWPNDPISFKIVNILIHLANSVLMAIIIYWLLPYLFTMPASYRLHLAIAMATFWALLPIQVSTVLYVIQRMVLLSSFFMLLTIGFYIWARSEVRQNRLLPGGLLFCLGVGISSLLAILSKESGLLVFAFLLTIEAFVSQKSPIDNAKVRYLLIFTLSFPLILFVAYVIYKGNYQHYDSRTFTLTERVLTQPRVLLDYLQQIILPVQSQLGLYHDDYLKSTNLTSPASTVWAILFWGVFAIVAIWNWKAQKSWIFFTFFWFISGHLMESTVLPLELYFEHRNYLSSMGIILGMFGVMTIVYSRLKTDYIKKIVQCGLAIYVCLIISITISHSRLWGNKAEYMIVSAKEHPESLRARMLMVDYYDATGNIEKANEEISKISQDFPFEVAIRFSKIHYSCKNELDIGKFDFSDEVLNMGRFSNATESTILKIIELKREKKCNRVSYEYLLGLVNKLLDNNYYKPVEGRFLRIKAILHFELGEYAKAIELLESLGDRDFADELGLIILYSRIHNFEKSEKLIALVESKQLTEYEKKTMNEIKQQIAVIKTKVN